MECVEGFRTPDRGAISVLGLDPFRDAYKLQDRIGVQLQQAQLQKRIKVWEAVHLWASLYRRKIVRRRAAARAARAGRQAQRLVHDAVGRPEAAPLHRARADQRSRDRVPRRADDRARSAGAPRDLGSGPRHPRARQDRVPDDAPDGRGRAAVRPRGGDRARTAGRHRRPGGAGAAALPRADRGADDRATRAPRSASARFRASSRSCGRSRATRSAAAATTSSPR